MKPNDTKQNRYRAEYEENLEAELDTVNDKINELGIQSPDLNAKFQAAQAGLRELTETPDESWEEMRNRVGTLFFELNKALDDASPDSR
jgi:hypothetical protein